MNENQFVDLREPKAVEIKIRQDGKVIWVNVDGQCVFRCHNPQFLEVVDEREETPNKDVVAPEYQYLTEGGQKLTEEEIKAAFNRGVEIAKRWEQEKVDKP